MLPETAFLNFWTITSVVTEYRIIRRLLNIVTRKQYWHSENRAYALWMSSTRVGSAGTVSSVIATVIRKSSYWSSPWKKTVAASCVPVCCIATVVEPDRGSLRLHAQLHSSKVQVVFQQTF